MGGKKHQEGILNVWAVSALYNRTEDGTQTRGGQLSLNHQAIIEAVLLLLVSSFCRYVFFFLLSSSVYQAMYLSPFRSRSLVFRSYRSLVRLIISF